MISRRMQLGHTTADWDNYDDSQEKPGVLDVWNGTQLQQLSGLDLQGRRVKGEYQRPVFILTPDERNQIFQQCSYLLAVVTSRMNRVSSLNFTIKQDSLDFEEILLGLKMRKQLYDEREGATTLDEARVRLDQVVELRKFLPDLKNDLSNFTASLRRFKAILRAKEKRQVAEIEEWLAKKMSIREFTKAWVRDFCLHGVSAVYKKRDDFGKLESFHNILGGSTFPIRGEYVDEHPEIYVQLTDSFGYTHEPRFMYADDIDYRKYVPASDTSYGYVPIDSLINKIAESLLYDEKMAKYSDGTRPPELAIVFGQNQIPFGNLTGTEDRGMPMDQDNSARLEKKLSLARRQAIVVLSGVGKPMTVPLSKTDQLAVQQQRQDKILRDIALVFNMSNMEVNLSGGEFTSGRETSDQQADIEEGKGTQPIVQVLEDFWTQLIRDKFGGKWKWEYEKGQTDLERTQLDASKLQAGHTVNEVREDREQDAIDGEEFDKPATGGGQPNQEQGGMMGGMPDMGGMM